MPEKSASAEIRRHIRKILMQERDPIGVSDVSEAADEYDGYIDRVHNLITRGASEHEIAAYLRSVEVAEMGMVDAKGGAFVGTGQADQGRLVAQRAIATAHLIPPHAKCVETGYA